MSLLFFQLVSAFLAYSCMLDTLLNILVAFLWPCFSKSLSLLKSMYSLSGVPGPDLALQMSLLSAEQRRITSPHLLTVHFLTQCRLVLAVFATGTHRLKVSCLSTLTPGPSFRAASQSVIAQPVQMPGATPPLMQDFAFPFTELHKISVSLFLHLSRSH